MPTMVNPPVNEGTLANKADLVHAQQHAAEGVDPLTPEAIGAAKSGHNHDNTYAAKNHDHSDKAAANHTHDDKADKAYMSLQAIPPYASCVRSSPDANGVYTVYTWEVPAAYVTAGYPAKWVSTLSGGTSPNYTTRTFAVYGSDKTTLQKTFTYTLAYDADSKVVSETLTGVQ